MSALSKIRSAGFTLSLVDDGFAISPSSDLSLSQKEFLKQHKAELVEELRSEAEILRVTVYTPAGGAVTVQADDADHAEWLKRMNPKPKGVI